MPTPAADQPPAPSTPASVEVPRATGSAAISRLNEYAQRTGHRLSYAFDQSGPPHQLTIYALVTLELPDGDRQARGRGLSKATAKANAASALLTTLADEPAQDGATESEESEGEDPA